jgi:hypothetical protein
MFNEAYNLPLANALIVAGVLIAPVMFFIGHRAEKSGAGERTRKLGLAISMCLIASGLLFRVDYAATAAGNAIGPVLGIFALCYALRTTWVVRIRDDILGPAVPLEKTLANVAIWSAGLIAGGFVVAIRSL